MERSEADDALLRFRCDALAAELLALDRPGALDALADPRGLHGRLFAGLTPADHPELAGHYRGADFPLLKTCTVYSAFNASEGTRDLAGPEQVENLMWDYGRALQRHGTTTPRTVPHALGIAAPLMIVFGCVHPFIDGNGHIQRLTVQHLLHSAGFALNPSWTINPRPYGEAMHRALALRDVPSVTTLLATFVCA